MYMTAGRARGLKGNLIYDSTKLWLLYTFNVSFNIRVYSIVTLETLLFLKCSFYFMAGWHAAYFNRKLHLGRSSKQNCLQHSFDMVIESIRC